MGKCREEPAVGQAFWVELRKATEAWRKVQKI